MDCNEREYTRMEADFSRVLEEMNIMLPSDLSVLFLLYLNNLTPG